VVLVNDEDPELVDHKRCGVSPIPSSDFEIETSIGGPGLVTVEHLLVLAVIRILEPVEVLENGSQKMR
jgi:hypothetical protein